MINEKKMQSSLGGEAVDQSKDNSAEKQSDNEAFEQEVDAEQLLSDIESLQTKQEEIESLESEIENIDPNSQELKKLKEEYNKILWKLNCLNGAPVSIAALAGGTAVASDYGVAAGSVAMFITAAATVGYFMREKALNNKAAILESEIEKREEVSKNVESEEDLDVLVEGHQDAQGETGESKKGTKKKSVKENNKETQPILDWKSYLGMGD